VFTQHPTLLIGPSDWDPWRAPLVEFDERLVALWAAFPNASRAIVFGSAAHHAELTYLTNFVPKLEPGIALLGRGPSAKLLFGGGPNMIGAMKPLTFIDEMAPLNALPKLIAGWKAPLLIGAGAMTSAMRKTIDEACNGSAIDATAHIQSMMQRKSPNERDAIRDACACLSRAISAIDRAARQGHYSATALHRGEQAAILTGAQDVRTLFSLDGGRTLRSFETNDDRRTDPLQVYVAVRRFNYWAEGFACFSNASSPAAARAVELLNNALAAMRPGLSVARLSKGLAAAPPYRPHPVIQDAPIAAIGLSLDAPTPTVIQAGGVYSVRAGVTDDAGQHAIVSAMVAIHERDAEMLWRSGIA
jgi:hypothetical protein